MAGPWEKFQPQQNVSNGPWEQFNTPSDPTQQASRVNPVMSQELSIGERVISALPKGIKNWLSDPSVAGVGLGKGSSVNGAMMGAADPVVGALQLITGGQSSTVNQAIDSKNSEYEQSRTGQGRDGFDAARLVGNISSPANLAVAQIAPINALKTGGKILQGARAGAIGAASAPVLNADEGYVGEKALQTGIGAVTGGLIAPVASKVGDAVTRKVIGLNSVDASLQADKIMIEGINRLQRDGVQLAAPDLAQLRQQVVMSLQQGKKLDPAALFRKQDFEALGMKPTLGQITRDGQQFSREKNLRGVAGVGEPLLQRFDQQAQRLQELLTGKSSGAADEFTAGQQMMASLKGVDDGMRKNVGGLYQSARNSTGKDLDIPLQGLAQDYANVLSTFGDKVPSGVRGNFEALGLGKGTQQKVFNFEEADKLLKVINSNTSNDPAVNASLKQLRDAVKNAVMSVDATGGPFAPAVAAARQRFSIHDAVPALKASADGDVSAQDFTRRFLINGKAEEVAGLAKVLPSAEFQEARKQLGAALERSAFGQNTTGDKAFAQESFAKFLNQPGMKQKIGAFFSDGEVKEIERISRVGAYMSSFPANSTVNTSNTAAAMMNLLNRVPGIPAGIGMLNSAKNAATNQMTVNSAIRANPAQSSADIAPEQAKLLSRILGYGMGGVAGAAGTGIGN